MINVGLEVMADKIVRLRELKGAQILDVVSCAAISSRFFNRTRSWFMQRLNNNTVNGKPASFTPEELSRLSEALKTLASELISFTNKIPTMSTDSSIKVYVIEDPQLIRCLENDDFEGFKESLQEVDPLDIPDPECFDTEAEALSFCAGLGYGRDDYSPIHHYPLCSFKPVDVQYINIIEF